MEALGPNAEDDDVFFDALDDFPFYDCVSSLPAQPDPSTSSSALSTSDSVPEVPSRGSTLRRRSVSRGTLSGEVFKDSSLDLDSHSHSALHSDVDYEIDTTSSSREWKNRSHWMENQKLDPEPPQEPVPSVAQAQSLNSTVTVETNDEVESDSADSAAEPSDPSFNFLVSIAGLVIKAISFQINLFITFTTFPLLLLYHSYVLITNPFQAVRKGRDYLVQKISKLGHIARESASPWLNELSREYRGFWKVVSRCAWGLLWSVYVCVILCGMFVSSLAVSGIFMRCLVKEPIQMKEVLNFDYTKPSPVAYVPVALRCGVACGEDCQEDITGLRVIPPGHRLQVLVSLTLPESEYNQNLGVFQIRVDFLSANGKTLASSSRPCMLPFKSEPVRLLLTFLKIAPLLAGYVSESQTLNLKFRGFTEGDIPTACLKVAMEQRAEYRPGAGIPEIYDAFLILESELPLFKKIIWYWKKTIFVWISMTSFMMQLLFTLVCCRCIIIPKARSREGSPRSSTTQDSLPAQG